MTLNWSAVCLSLQRGVGERWLKKGRGKKLTVLWPVTRSFAFSPGQTDLQVHQSFKLASASESVGQSFMLAVHVFVVVVVDLLNCL